VRREAASMAEPIAMTSRTGFQAIRHRYRLGHRMACYAGHTIESLAL
jgi:hypothetical protein